MHVIIAKHLPEPSLWGLHKANSSDSIMAGHILKSINLLIEKLNWVNGFALIVECNKASH